MAKKKKKNETDYSANPPNLCPDEIQAIISNLQYLLKDITAINFIASVCIGIALEKLEATRIAVINMNNLRDETKK